MQQTRRTADGHSTQARAGAQTSMHASASCHAYWHASDDKYMHMPQGAVCLAASMSAHHTGHVSGWDVCTRVKLLLSAPLLLLAAPLLLLSAPLLLLAAPLLLDEWQGSAWPYDGMQAGAMRLL
jgi:hypothetical protein